MYALMRPALVPTSLPPTRDTERMSIRLPPACSRTRITTSSLKPNQRVVSVASIRPCPGSTATISHPMALAACSAAANASSRGRRTIAGARSG